LVATATCLGVRKTNFRFIIYSHGFTNPANSAKIDGVDFEIIGLKGIVKMLKKIRNSSRTGSPPGGLNYMINDSKSRMASSECNGASQVWSWR